MRRTLKAWVALVTSFSLVTCASSGIPTVQEEKQLGNQARAQVQQAFTLVRDRVIVLYIRQLGAELVEASRPSPFKPSFGIVEDPALNAFATPGANIYVTTGTILAVDSVDELAAVIGHEIGHATARHSAKSLPVRERTGFVARLLGLVISIATGRRAARNVGILATNLATTAYFTTHSREAEREADELAIETLYTAGYDPDGLIRFFEKIQKQSAGRGVPRFLQTHPLPAERIENINKLIDARGLPENRIEPDNEKLELIQARIRLMTGFDEGIDGGVDPEDAP